MFFPARKLEDQGGSTNRSQIRIAALADETRGEDINRHIGRALRQRRRELNLTLRDVAAKLGLSYQQIQKYEGGGNRISVAQLVDLATALDVPPVYFLWEFDHSAGSRFGAMDAEMEVCVRKLLGSRDVRARRVIMDAIGIML